MQSRKLKYRSGVVPLFAAGSLLLSGLSAPLMAGPAWSSESPESFRLELTGSAWLLNTSGTIQSNGSPIDLVSDLGAEQQQPTFFGRLVIKPGRKHRIVMEGTPFRVSGFNTVDRTIVYRGQTFDVAQTLRSAADLNYFYAGYQYDLLSGSMGHLGLSAGGAYLSASGTINGVETGITATRSETVGLPLAGAEGRLFPWRGHRLFTIEADVHGMALASYGEYLEASGSGGVTFGRISLLAGYRSVHADIHTASSTNPEGVDAHFNGPIFSAQWRW